MLDGGYWAGSATLCAGPSGIGKTLMGLHFIVEGAERGEPGVVASLQENPSQLERVAHSFSWSLDGAVDVSTARRSTSRSMSGSTPSSTRSNGLGARRVLIDSLADLQYASGDTTRFREFMYSLTQRFSRAGVSVFMTSELARSVRRQPPLRPRRLAPLGQRAAPPVPPRRLERPPRADRAEDEGYEERGEVREFSITQTGIVLGETIDSRPSTAVT